MTNWRRLRPRTVQAVALLIVGCLGTGCRPAADATSGSPPEASEPTAARTVKGTGGPRGSAQHRDATLDRESASSASDPERLRQRLRNVFTRYRTASSYRDQAQVELEYRGGDSSTGNSSADPRRQSSVSRKVTAPLRVWYDRGTLLVEAYDVRLQSGTDGLICRILNSANDDLDSQVVYAPPAEINDRNGVTLNRPVLDVLLSDPMVAERVAGGLAGPPPQLEWLFADDPMPGLFQPDVRLGAQPDADIDGVRCQRIIAEVDDERYVFWIDRARGLVRRIDLPSIASSGPVASSEMRLRIDFRQATFSPQQGPSPKISLPAEPKYVRQFVPPPPPEPDSRLGKRPAPFSIRPRGAEWTLSERGSDRELTVIVAVGDDAASPIALAIIEGWVNQLPASLSQRIRTVPLVDSRLLPRLSSEFRLPFAPDPEGRLSESLGIPAGGLAILANEGTLVWLQPQLQAVDVPTLGAVVADLLRGVDVPRRLREQWREDLDAYRQELRRQRIQPEL